MYEQIRRIVYHAMKGIKAKLLIGTVVSINPFLVSVEQRLQLPGEVLLFPSYLQETKLKIMDWKTEPCSGGDIGSGGTKEEIEREIIIRPKLQVDDKLILMNLGDNFLVLDKVGDINESIVITE